jgi:hypothetical protein
MQLFPRHVILAIVLLDLPIVIHEKDSVQMNAGFGSSWWYINCDCDDFYVDVVEDIISLCTFPQIRTMCFVNRNNDGSGSSNNNNNCHDGNDSSLILRATPKCRAALQSALRFVGRYEFLGDSPVQSNVTLGLKVFDALDFGTRLNPHPDGKNILLTCYSRYDTFRKEVSSVMIVLASFSRQYNNVVLVASND